MPTRHFLTARGGLSEQVADWLIRGERDGALQLATTQLVLPTAGAERQVSQRIKAAGLQPPAGTQPMQAMLLKSESTATPVERCLAWSEVLQAGPREALQALFWQAAPETPAELLKAGRKFCQLCDQLGEAALTPGSMDLSAAPAGTFDAGRWQALATLYADYLTCLSRWRLEDPNERRRAHIERAESPFARIVFAGLPDLPTAAARYGAQLERSGTTVDVLIWNPGCRDESDFDAWGRPVTERWNARTLEIAPEQIQVAPSARDEARLAGIALTRDTSEPAGLVLADPKLQSALSGEILSLGGRPYRPEGDPLIRCEAATLALGWEAFRADQDLRGLRRLLELPAFCRALEADPALSQTEALGAVDQLLGLTIAADLETARMAMASAESMPAFKGDDLARIRRLLSAIQAALRGSALDLVERAWSDPETRPETAQAVLDLGHDLERSLAVQNWSPRRSSEALPVQVLAQALRGAQILSPAGADAVVLNGWLEAAWLPQARLHISGMVDGAVPQSVDGDPFLPDSIRPALGLSHNDQRLARDAYLLDCLLQSRPADALTLSFSKYNQDGDPNRPSRLLLRTELEALPERVRHVLKPQASTRVRPKRETSWRWRLPDALPVVTRLSPTQFKAYLECPFRFYLEKVLRLDSGPVAAHEMDAAVFGNLIHRSLEAFGNQAIDLGDAMLRLDEATIRDWVREALDKEARRQFGPKQSPAVQVQLANAASRLNAFARKQAECFSEGWRILRVEAKLEADGERPLMIGPLPLSGVIDRIEQHNGSGALRILDYKTFSSLTKPAAAHLGPVSRSWFPEAQVQIGTKLRAWADLQLPLYRRILEHWYPEATAAHLPEVAYFVLPSDPGESDIYRFEELNDPALYAAACACAAKVAESIAAGCFWPPQPFRGNWDDPLAGLFVNGEPEQCIDPESIERLKGGAA